MSNPDLILTMIPDGKLGIRPLQFVLDDVPSAYWISLFFAAFDAATTGTTVAVDGDDAVYVTSLTRIVDPSTDAVSYKEDAEDGGEDAKVRLFNLVDYWGNDADADHDDYKVILGWNADYRKSPRKGISFNGAIMTIRGLDPAATFTAGVDGNNPGVIDVVYNVVADVGETDTGAGNYAMSFHKHLAEADSDVDGIQGKFSSTE